MRTDEGKKRFMLTCSHQPLIVEQMFTVFKFRIEAPSTGLYLTKNIALPSSPTLLVYFTMEEPSDGFEHELTFSFLSQ